MLRLITPNWRLNIVDRELEIEDLKDDIRQLRVVVDERGSLILGGYERAKKTGELIAEKDRRIHELGKQLSLAEQWKDEAYTDLNLLVQVCAKMAQFAERHDAGMGLDPEAGPEWPVIFINLPTGQISFHIPNDEVVPGRYPGHIKWDGHTKEEARQRMELYVREMKWVSDNADVYFLKTEDDEEA